MRHTSFQVALWILVAVCSNAHAGTVYSFQTLNNPADPTFNQILGINNTGTAVGYFGSGSSTSPNKGFVVNLFSGPSAFTDQNFPASVQTQVVGLNNNTSPTTVGFWVDAMGDNFGFVKHGTTFTDVVNPATNMNQTNQLLGVNDHNIAVGFFTDDNGNANAYSYNIATQGFTAITPPSAWGAVAVTATGINDAGEISGFYTDANGDVHGFIDNQGTFTSFDDPTADSSNTMFFGINNNGVAVGSFDDGAGVTRGLVFNSFFDVFTTIDDPNASATPAFDVNGTLINGINDNGTLVGFYSDGTNINGFVATATPEPSSVSLGALSGLLLAATLVRKQRRRAAAIRRS